MKNDLESESRADEEAGDRRYLLTAALAALACIAAISVFNWWQNPFNIFAPHGKVPSMFPHPRISKTYLPRQIHPKTVIMGTSRAELGIPTQHPGWSALPVLNLGLSGTSFEEISRYFENACEGAPVSHAVIMLDYTSCNAEYEKQPTFDPGRLATRDGPPAWTSRLRDHWLALTTWDALESSLAGMRIRPRDADFYPSGERNETVHYRKILSKGPLGRSFNRMEAGFSMKRGSLEQNWLPLRRAARVAADKKVQLTWIITPFHDHLWRLFAQRDGLDAVLNWRRDVVDILFDEAASQGQPAPVIWDFDGTSLTAMPLAEIEADAKVHSVPLFFEYSHFSTRVGAMMLDRALLNKPPVTQGFGTRLTKNNITTRLEQLRSLWSQKDS